MTNHCDTKAAALVADDQFTPASSKGGSVVRYRLEAGDVEWQIAPGCTVRGYGFNGHVPGPVLEAKQGVPLEIEFTNRLPEPTVIHWHGLRIPAAMDGTEVVQRPVQPARDVHVSLHAARRWHVLVSPAPQRDRAAGEGALRRADRPRRGRTGARRREDPRLRRPARGQERTDREVRRPDGPPQRSRGFKLSVRRGLDFVVNGERHHHDEPVKVGELQVWDVVNTTRMDHPFHLHGFFFQVLEINGKKPAWRSLEDVINVPAQATVRIAWYPDDRPGMWMYHCHILEHHAAGMMAHFEVVR
jgi:FtsP/CotA-like multicopper oxidase with cupredoxin domain